MTRDADTKYLPLLDHITIQPVFILGLQRSGTTILYETLQHTDLFNVVTIYDILNYDALLATHYQRKDAQEQEALTKTLTTLGITTRRTDAIPITPTSTQEYIYLYTLHGHPQHTTTHNYQLLQTLCKKIQYIQGNTKPILLKNPSDLPYFLTLKTLFPTARFIFIHRDPLKVLDSTLRAWRTLYHHYNPYTALFNPNYQGIYHNPLTRTLIRLLFDPPLPPGLITDTLTAHRRLTHYLTHINQLPASDYTAIRYEDLCSDTTPTITQILHNLNLPTPTNLPAKLTPRDLPLLPDTARLQHYINAKMAAYRTALHYTQGTKPK